MSEEEKILEFIQQEYGNYDNYVRDLLDLYNKEKEKNKELEENYILKSKVREKIEELKKEADYRTIDNPTGRIHFHKEPCDYQIEILQSILQEGDK